MLRVGNAWKLAAGNIPEILLGRLAQLVEHLVYTEGVGGSSPSSPTIRPARTGGPFNKGFAMARDPQELHRSAITLMQQGRLAEAAPLFDELTRRQPKFAMGWLAAGNLASMLGDTAKAWQCLQKAHRLEPRNPGVAVFHAHCASQAGTPAETRAAALAALQLNPSDPHMLNTLAAVFSELNDQETAHKIVSRAAKMLPKDPGVLFNLASVLRFMGRAEEAERVLDRVIALQPDNHEAYLVRSSLRSQTSDRNHLAELERKSGDYALPSEGAIIIDYALGKELEDLGRWSDAFAAFDRAAALQRSVAPYDVAKDELLMTEMVQQFTAEDLGARARGTPSDKPIFVIGLPRSGTTLVERILSSHPTVVSVGESPDFSRLLGDEMAKRGALPQGAADTVERIKRVDSRALGRNYLRRLAERAAAQPSDKKDITRVIDKMPYNYLYVGAIHRALPDARIIQLQRDPMDSCLGLFKTHFKSGNAAFSYDLRDLERYFIAYSQLMDHWQKALPPGKMLTLRYEEIVEDLEGSVKRLLDFCDLAWDPACLDFHENPSPSTTQSALQVRQPLYRSAIGRWKHYETELADLAEGLGAAGYLSS